MEVAEDRLEAAGRRIGRRRLLARALGLAGLATGLAACKHLSLGATTAPGDDEPTGDGEGGGGTGGGSSGTGASPGF